MKNKLSTVFLLLIVIILSCIVIFLIQTGKTTKVENVVSKVEENEQSKIEEEEVWVEEITENEEEKKVKEDKEDKEEEQAIVYKKDDEISEKLLEKVDFPAYVLSEITKLGKIEEGKFPNDLALSMAWSKACDKDKCEYVVVDNGNIVPLTKVYMSKKDIKDGIVDIFGDEFKYKEEEFDIIKDQTFESRTCYSGNVVMENDKFRINSYQVQDCPVHYIFQNFEYLSIQGKEASLGVKIAYVVPMSFKDSEGFSQDRWSIYSKYSEENGFEGYIKEIVAPENEENTDVVFENIETQLDTFEYKFEFNDYSSNYDLKSIERILK